MRDLDLFQNLIDERDGSSIHVPSLDEIASDDQFRVLILRFVQFVNAYTKISRHYFPNLRLRIPPYTDSDVGVWVNLNPIMYMLRARTGEYPDYIVFEPETMNRIWGRIWETQPDVFRILGRPAGTVQVGIPDLARNLPQSVAWDRLVHELTALVENGLLDENVSSTIMHERIRELLLYTPSGWPSEIEDEGRNFERLGFDSAETVYQTHLGDLIQPINDALTVYRRRAEEADSRPMQHWFWKRFSDYYVLQYWLSALREESDHLERPAYSRDEISRTVLNHESAVPIFARLLPDILDAYRSVVENNFPGLASLLELYQNFDRPILVEITGGHHGFIDIRYVVLKTRELDTRYLVYWRNSAESLGRQELTVRQTLRGATWTSAGAKYGKTALSLRVEGLDIQEPHAVVYRTRFPSQPAVTSQVYQLIAAELERFLRSRRLQWRMVGGPQFDSMSLAQLLTQRFVGEPPPGNAEDDGN